MNVACVQTQAPSPTLPRDAGEGVFILPLPQDKSAGSGFLYSLSLRERAGVRVVSTPPTHNHNH